MAFFDVDVKQEAVFRGRGKTGGGGGQVCFGWAVGLSGQRVWSEPLYSPWGRLQTGRQLWSYAADLFLGVLDVWW